MNTLDNQPISNIIDSQNGEEQGFCFTSCSFCSHCDEKDNEIKRLKEALEASEDKIVELEATIKALMAKVKSLAQLLFGRSTEKDPFQEEVPAEPTETTPPSTVGKDSPGEAVRKPIEEDPKPKPTEEDTRTDTPEPKNKRKRGGQFGRDGHGRTIPQEIPVEVVIIDVPEEERTCGVCGIPYEPSPFVETSSTIDVKIVIYRKKEVRKRYKRACDCEENKSRFITAPKEPQALEKSKFSHGLIAFLLALKYLYAIPLERAISFLNLFGAELASSSIIGTFKSLFPLFQALYDSMVEAMKKAGQWNIDETSYFTYIKQKGKKTFLNWMWVFSTKTMVLYKYAATRASSVPLMFLGNTAIGVIICDRFSAYKKLAKLISGVILAYCWAHFRRDFIKAGQKYKELESWANEWLDRIAKIYYLNNVRLECIDDPIRFKQAQNDLENAVKDFKNKIDEEAADESLHPYQKKVLKSAIDHWEGLTVFVKFSEVPIDNNEAERNIRTIALQRNNFLGSHAEWSASFNAVILLLLQSAKINNLNPIAYLHYYLDACAKAGGVPPNLERFHPHNVSPEVLEKYGMFSDKIASWAKNLVDHSDSNEDE